MTTPLTDAPWAKARVRAYEVAAPTATESVPLGSASGRVLAEPIIAQTSLPAAATSAMDGWAVNGARGPWRLITSALAGHPPTTALRLGTGATIGTGGIVPTGTEGIIRREHGRTLRQDDGTEWVHSTYNPNPHDIRPQGEETTRGDVLLPAGTILTPPQVGLAAAVGYDRIRTHRRPRVLLAILGDEVQRTGVPRLGHVRDSLGPSLPAALELLGASTPEVTFVADRPDDVVQLLSNTNADVVVTTGGTAAGPADFLHRALGAARATLIIDRVAMRPGHPALLAALGRNRFCVGLPGNPQAAMAALLTLAAPLLAALGARTMPQLGTVVVQELVPGPGHTTRLVPYTRHGDGVRPTPWLGPGMLRGLALADGVMAVPPGGVGAGATVPDVPLPWA